MLRSRVKQLEQELKWQESRIDSISNNLRELREMLCLLTKVLGYYYHVRPEKLELLKKDGPEPGND